ncbi:MAG TPA: GntR family transcriptional regulator [Syntrophorhabdales bacterium]|nr:GntR family transcriptional regulator [Syntrophorhabdales bacterium]
MAFDGVYQQVCLVAPKAEFGMWQPIRVKRGCMGREKTVSKMGRPLKGIRAVGKRRPVGEVAYTALREAIVKGDLHPGQRLVESTLSSQMGISRIPVREAIKKLEQDGLVEKLDKRGFIVNNPSREEIEETFGIRAILESYAAALCTQHMNQRILNKIEDTLSRYRDALGRADIAKMTELNAQFDQIIISTAGSKKLYSLIENFRDFIFRYRNQLLASMNYASISLSDHERIVEAMKEGDVEKVEKLVREHLLRGKDILLRDINFEGGDRPDTVKSSGDAKRI